MWRANQTLFELNLQLPLSQLDGPHDLPALHQYSLMQEWQVLQSLLRRPQFTSIKQSRLQMWSGNQTSFESVHLGASHRQ